MPGIGVGMNRFRTGLNWFRYSGHDWHAEEAESADGIRMLEWIGLCGAAAAAMLICAALSTWTLLDAVLLAIAGALALAVGFLLKRHQHFNRTLAAERRHLHTAVSNIPQGLVVYDASARIVICNQQYLDMFGLSPDVAKPGCTCSG